jgi:hypothetical protein
MYWEDHINVIALYGVLVGGLLWFVLSIIWRDPSCTLYNTCKLTCTVLQPRPTTGYKVDIIVANRIHISSSTSQNLTGPKCSLVLAITFVMLALYRNWVTCCEIVCGFPTKTKHPLQGWYHLSNRINVRSSISQNQIAPKPSLVLVITFEMLALYRNLVKCREI